MSRNTVAAQLKIPKSTARSVRTKYEKTGTIKTKLSTGQPAKFSKRDERQVVRFALQNIKLSSPRFYSKFNESRSEKTISLMTIRRILKKNKFKSFRACRKIKLSKSDRDRRLSWCNERKNWAEAEWSKIFFSDECRFALASDSKILIRARFSDLLSQDCFNYIPPNKKSVIYWGCISASGTACLIKCPID